MDIDRNDQDLFYSVIFIQPHKKFEDIFYETPDFSVH